MRNIPVLIMAGLLLATGCNGPGKMSRYTAQLIRDLKSPDEQTRQGAALQLGFKHNEKRFVMLELAKYVDDKDPILANNAHQSLQNLTGDDSIPQERQAWEDYVRRLLKSLDETGKPPVDTIKKEQAKLRNQEGYYLLSCGNFLEAEQKFLNAIALDPDNADYHNNLAKSYLNMQRYRDGLQYSMRAIALNPDLAVAYMNEGDAYAGLEKPYEATNAYLEALKLDKDRKDWATRLKLAKLYLKQGMLDDAQSQIDTAIEINAREPDVRAAAALIRYGRQEYYKSWQQVLKVQELGYDMNPAFITKLKIELRRMGMDFPEDKEADDKLLPALDTDNLMPGSDLSPRRQP